MNQERIASGLAQLTPERLAGIRRGVEKESLRSTPDGRLALTPHPAGLGAAMTHPHITTDFSESQLELITGVHDSIAGTLAELEEVHRYTQHVLGEEAMWSSSMPCGLPSDETIPIGRYGHSHVGRIKSVYRAGLSVRYGRRMQTISGIHYNWSLPGLDDADHFALIRNFRRHVFLPLFLTGASPAVCRGFVEGRAHELQPLGDITFHAPFGTSLRMGRLGYQSDAQGSLAVSFNSLAEYAASLRDALTRPWPAYEAIGVRNLGGEYNQLSTTLLQIENEFYGMIRPKRTTRSGERPLNALNDRGVEYLEVRMLDLDPFLPTGIGADTIRLIDVFLLHCLLSDSPPDSPEEIHEIKCNQHLTAARGREPGLLLQRFGQAVTLRDWGRELLRECLPIAEHLDRHDGGEVHVRVIETAMQVMAYPHLAPSARVLQAILEEGGSQHEMVRRRSEAHRRFLMTKPLPSEIRGRYMQMAEESVRRQKEIERTDSASFEDYRTQFLSAVQRAMPGGA